MRDIGANVFAAATVTFLEQFRFSFCTEEELQDGIWKAIQTAWPDPTEWTREHRLSAKDRIDFYNEATGIGVEAKISHPLGSLTRQLHRYAQHDSIKGLVLITSQVRLTQLPGHLNTKPLMTVNLIGSLL